jgi:hypothetical protein
MTFDTMGFLHSNLAYRYLALAMMISHANWFCHQLKLAQLHELTMADVQQGSSVDPVATNDFGGSLVTSEYFFGFDSGHLANFVKQGHWPQTEAGIREQNVELSHHTSMIDTNGAVKLATNWLAIVGIKLGFLMTNYTLSVHQWQHIPDYNPQLSASRQKSVPLPIFDVEWKGDFLRKGWIHHRGTVVKIVVSGISDELWEYHVYTDQLATKPPITIKDAASVLAVPDSEFEAYDRLRRASFLARFGISVAE